MSYIYVLKTRSNAGKYTYMYILCTAQKSLDKEKKSIKFFEAAKCIYFQLFDPDEFLQDVFIH